MRNTLRIGMLALLAGASMAAVYSYKCPKCGLIQQYERAGIYKCPKDNYILTVLR